MRELSSRLWFRLLQGLHKAAVILASPAAVARDLPELAELVHWEASPLLQASFLNTKELKNFTFIPPTTSLTQFVEEGRGPDPCNTDNEH